MIKKQYMLLKICGFWLIGIGILNLILSLLGFDKALLKVLDVIGIVSVVVVAIIVIFTLVRRLMLRKKEN